MYTSVGDEFQNLNDTAETITIKLDDLLEESGTPFRIGTSSSYMMDDSMLLHTEQQHNRNNEDLVTGALV